MSQLLALMTMLPTPPIVPVGGADGWRYQTSSTIFASILATHPNATILNDSEELRYLPYTLSGTHILLVLKGVGSWSDEKSNRVLSVARLQKNSISIVWLGEAPIPESFRKLTTQLGGRVIEFRELNRSILQYVCL